MNFADFFVNFGFYIFKQCKAAATSQPAATAPTSAPTPTPVASAPTQAAAPPATSGRLKVSPYARNLATEKNVPLQELTGSGPGGRIRANDVNSYVPSQPATTVTAAPVATQAHSIQGRVLFIELH